MNIIEIIVVVIGSSCFIVIGVIGFFVFAEFGRRKRGHNQ